jgi:hypothetical protein
LNTSHFGNQIYGECAKKLPGPLPKNFRPV